MDTIESILTQLLPVTDSFSSSGLSTASQLIQNCVYLLSWDRQCLPLEVSLVDSQTEVTRLASENQTLRGAHERLTAAEEQHAKL